LPSIASKAFLEIFSITHSKRAALTAIIISFELSKSVMNLIFDEVLDLR